jgi:hypothetical protein
LSRPTGIFGSSQPLKRGFVTVPGRLIGEPRGTFPELRLIRAPPGSRIGSRREIVMSINSEQIPFRQIRLEGDSAIAPAIRFRGYRFVSAARKSRMFRRKWQPRARQMLSHPFAWTLAALIVSSIGLYYDLR